MKLFVAGGFLLLLLGLVAAALLARGKPRMIRSGGAWTIFEAPGDVEGPFIAWLKGKGFAPADGGWRGPSGTKGPMSVVLLRQDGRLKVNTTWTFEGPASEEHEDEIKAEAFNQALLDWWEKNK